MLVEVPDDKRIESKQDIQSYITKLKYTLTDAHTIIRFQEERQVDKERNQRFTNRFTVADLFPNEDVSTALRRELATLSIKNYIETVKDKRLPKLSEMRVFGKIYNGKDVYIKIRAELMRAGSAGVDNLVFIMSFHYAEIAFKDSDFPYGR